MINLFSDILKAKISAFAGKSLLFHFPANGFFYLLLAPFVNKVSINEQKMSLLQMVMVRAELNNQRFNQQSIQQQIRIT